MVCALLFKATKKTINVNYEKYISTSEQANKLTSDLLLLYFLKT